MARLALSLALASALFALAVGCGYQTCPQSYDPSKIHLHIIAHSHDDVGWQKTADRYADDDVMPLISAVVAALQKNPQRKFVEVEMYFFRRWWQLQTPATQAEVKKLVTAGQFTFANGGWCVNDEAAAYYNAIVDQMTLGIEFLRDTFGECAEPKLSWQIDPFGAARENANLQSQMGFDGHILNRGGNLPGEFYWNTSLGHTVFTSRLHAHYSAPDGYNFENGNDITDANKKQRADHLVDIGKRWNRDYGKKGHVLMTFGDDFQYRHAERWFSNLDKLIAEVNAHHTDVALHYSSPHCYVKAVRDKKPTMETRSADFYPYWTWTGYFTSRPQLKATIRYADNLLQAAKQLEVLSDLGNLQALIYEGKNQLGVLQHHDAVTGTSPPPVTYDYRQRLYSAIHALQNAVSQALHKMTSKTALTDRTNLPYVYTTVNISDATHQLDADSFATIIYNPSVHAGEHWVRIPVSDATGYAVTDAEGVALKQVSHVPINSKVHSLANRHAAINYELVFSAKLPALGFTTYFVTKAKAAKLVESAHPIEKNAAEDYVLKGKTVQVVVDHKTGQVKSLIKAGGKTHKLSQSFLNYNNHKSDSYQFCPTGAAEDITAGATVAHVAKYEGFAEVTQKVHDYLWQTIRVYEDKDYVEFDFVVGPLGEDAESFHKDREIVTRFETDLKTDQTFYTDSNGRQNMHRHRNAGQIDCEGIRQAITPNFYPVTTRAFLRDEHSGEELTVLIDRSVGGASLADGALELMIHRRLWGNRGQGVNMDDSLDVGGHGFVARGKVLVYLSDKTASGDHQRQTASNLYKQPIISFVPTSDVSSYKSSHNLHYTALKATIPRNVELLTLENWGKVANNEVLVRFENIYDHGDQSALATAAKISLDAFTSVHIEQVEKTNLAVGSRAKLASNDVTLQLQEIGTYVYKVKRTETNTQCGFKWEKLVGGKQPAAAILAGHEGTAPLYICRHKSVDLIPGKFNQQLHCHVSYAGQDHTFNDAEVEVLTAASNNYQWVPRHGGDPHADQAFPAGHKANGVPLFVGRCAKYGGEIGKIDIYFYYGHDGREQKDFQDCINYEILTC